MRTRTGVVAALLTAGLLTAGCGTPGEPSRPVSANATATVPRPLNVQDPAEVPEPAAALALGELVMALRRLPR